jgi:hypothetical protein
VKGDGTGRSQNLVILDRASVTVRDAPAKQVVVQIEPAATGEGAPGVAPLGHAISPTPEPAPPKRAPAQYLWAVLIARIYEVFTPLCPLCGGQMRLIAFPTEGTQESDGFWSTSVSTRSPRTYPRRAGPRCGMTAMRMAVRVLRPSRTGQLVTGENGDSDPLPGSYAPAIPGAPPIPLVNSAFWRWIGQARSYCGRGAVFYVA